MRRGRHCDDVTGDDVTTEPASAAASADDDAAPVVDASRGGHVRLGSSLIGRGGRTAGVT